MKRSPHLLVLLAIVCCSSVATLDAADAAGGLDLGLGNLYRVSKAKSRSISPENFTGEKGKAGMATEGTGKNAARDLGRGWKLSPSVVIKPKSTFVIGEIKGPGCIQQIWMTPTGNWRRSILRVYWDGETEPSIECPVGDFFACNQFMNGKNMALVVMLPSHPLDNGGYAYRNQALRADGDGPVTWGELEIVGNRWVYSSDGTDNGKKTYWQTINLFSGPDKIHFEVQKSDDGVKWATTMSGDEARAK